jgi:hypothetical protein
MANSGECGDDPSSAIKVRDHLNCLYDLKKDLAPRSSLMSYCKISIVSSCNIIFCRGPATECTEAREAGQGLLHFEEF